VMLGVILIMEGLWSLDYTIRQEIEIVYSFVGEIAEYHHVKQFFFTRGYSLLLGDAYISYLIILLGLFLTALSTYWLGRLEQK